MKKDLPTFVENLTQEMQRCNETWSANPEALGETRTRTQVFIPTERAMFTRLAGLEPSVFHAPHQPEPLRHFGTTYEQQSS